MDFKFNFPFNPPPPPQPLQERPKFGFSFSARPALQFPRGGKPVLLPPEILIQIFLLSLPPLNVPQAPHKTALALVCRLWDAIVDSTPILWSGISATDSMTYVRKSLLKSAEHPIDVYGEGKDAHTGSDPYASCGRGCCEFLPAVTSHAERWRHVSLGVCGQGFTPSVTAFSSLQSLELQLGSNLPINDGFLLLLNGANSPHLREVRLHDTQILRWDLISFPPSLSTLEILDIWRVSPSVNRLFSILATCPNLTVLRLCNITGWQQREESDKNDHANAPTAVELAALQELKLSHISTDHLRELLRRVSVSDECMVSITHVLNTNSSSFFTPALSHHRGSFQDAKVTISVLLYKFSLIVVGQRWNMEFILDGGHDIRDTLEWFGISTANNGNGFSDSETFQASSITSNSTHITLKLDKRNKSYAFNFKHLAPVFDFECISRIEIDGLSAREEASFLWNLSGPEDLDQPSRAKDYYASDAPRPKNQTTGVWPFSGVSELVLKWTEADTMRALIDAIKRRSGDGATARAPGMPARLKRIEFVDGDEPTERGDDYLGVDAQDAERLVLEILDALDDDAELWWRGKRIDRA